MTEVHEQALPAGITCPKCGSSDVRRSKTEGFVAIALSVFGRAPLRCRSCRAKFYRHLPAEDSAE